MYEVFINERRLYIGSKAVCSGIDYTKFLPTDSLPDELIKTIRLMLRDQGPRLLCFGEVADAEAAWEILTSGMEEERALGGYVLNHLKQLLMIKRRGYWDIPKGKAFFGETMEETAVREVEEETGVSGLKPIEYMGETFHIFERGASLVLKRSAWFIMTTDYRGELRPQQEEAITDAIWVDFSAYLNLRDQIYPSLLRLSDDFWEKIRS